MKILMVDDEEDLRSGLAELLRRAGQQVVAVGDGASALPHLDDTDLLVTDIRMPALDGLGLLREARLRRPGLEIIVMTGFGSIPSAVEAMRLGARAYLTKPFDSDELLLHLRELENLHRLRAAGASRGDLVGTSAAMRRVYDEIDLAASSDATLLITGEAGSGKGLAARAVHAQSRRASGPFIVIDCAGLPREQIDSALFGHGSGTMAGGSGRGAFSLAEGGTLYLEAVDALPLDVQSKLLRAIESRQIQAGGAERKETVDLRLIAASGHDLELRIAEGAFRADLYYRLHVLRIDLPALRDHPEDIPQICHALLERMAPDPRLRPTLSTAALARLLARPWAGNVRELASALERAAARSRIGSATSPVTPTIGIEHLDAVPAGTLHLAYKQGRERAAEQWARSAIRSALIRSRGNTSEAARLLRMSRTALLRLVSRYDLR